MTQPMADLNGQLVPYSQVAILPHDAGMVWGAIVTERFRTWQGTFVRRADHLRRFRQSAAGSHVPLAESDNELVRAIDRVVNANRSDGDQAVVIVATPGGLSSFSPIEVASGPTRIIYSLPIDPEQLAAQYRAGARLICVPATLGVDPRIKHRSRLPWWIAAQQLHANDASASPLFCDPQTGEVLESASANLVIVRHGRLIAPPVGQVLEGVALTILAQIAEEIGAPLTRATIHADDLQQASEAMIANSTLGINWVSHLNGVDFQSAGPMTDALARRWPGRGVTPGWRS